MRLFYGRACPAQAQPPIGLQYSRDQRNYFLRSRSANRLLCLAGLGSAEIRLETCESLSVRGSQANCNGFHPKSHCTGSCTFLRFFPVAQFLYPNVLPLDFSFLRRFGAPLKRRLPHREPSGERNFRKKILRFRWSLFHRAVSRRQKKVALWGARLCLSPDHKATSLRVRCNETKPKKNQRIRARPGHLTGYSASC